MTGAPDPGAAPDVPARAGRACAWPRSRPGAPRRSPGSRRSPRAISRRRCSSTRHGPWSRARSTRRRGSRARQRPACGPSPRPGSRLATRRGRAAASIRVAVPLAVGIVGWLVVGCLTTIGVVLAGQRTPDPAFTWVDVAIVPIGAYLPLVLILVGLGAAADVRLGAGPGDGAAGAAVRIERRGADAGASPRPPPASSSRARPRPSRRPRPRSGSGSPAISTRASCRRSGGRSPRRSPGGDPAVLARPPPDGGRGAGAAHGGSLAGRARGVRARRGPGGRRGGARGRRLAADLDRCRTSRRSPAGDGRAGGMAVRPGRDRQRRPARGADQDRGHGRGRRGDAPARRGR